MTTTRTETGAYRAMLEHHAALVQGVAERVAALPRDGGPGGRFEPAAERLVAFLGQEVLPHAAAEEETIYPAAGTRPGLAGLVAGLVEEHRQLQASVERLATAREAQAAVREAGAIGSLFAAHVTKENEQLLAPLAADRTAGLAGLLERMHRLTEAARQGHPGAGADGGGRRGRPDEAVRPEEPVGRASVGPGTVRPTPPLDRCPELAVGLVAAAGDAIVIADRRGRIVTWNRGAETVFGYPAAEALGCSLEIIIPERLRARHWEGYHRTVQTGRTRHADDLLAVPAQRKDGTPLSIEFRVTLLPGPDGATDAIAAIIRDVTDHWQADRELRQELARLRASPEPTGGSGTSCSPRDRK